MRTVFAVSILLASSFALASEKAGPNVGGGGNAVVCFSDPAIPARIRDRSNPLHGQIIESDLAKISSIETYDLYIAKMFSGLEKKTRQVVQPTPDEPLRGYAEKIAKRFEAHVPFVAEMIRRGSANFLDEQITMRPDGLWRIRDEEDTEAYLDMVNCVVATMAAQKKIGQRHFMQIDERLFTHPVHSELSKAVLFLHEAVYSTVRWREINPHLTSQNTRLLIRRLITTDLPSAIELSELLKSLSFAESSSNSAYRWAVGSKKLFVDRLNREVPKAKYCPKEIPSDLNSSTPAGKAQVERAIDKRDQALAALEKRVAAVLFQTLETEVLPELHRQTHLSSAVRASLEKEMRAVVSKMEINVSYSYFWKGNKRLTEASVMANELACASETKHGWAWNQIGCGFKSSKGGPAKSKWGFNFNEPPSFLGGTCYAPFERLLKSAAQAE